MKVFSEHSKEGSKAILVIAGDDYQTWLDKQPSFTKNWVKSLRLKLSDNPVVIIPSERGETDYILAILSNINDLWQYAAIPAQLPKAEYHFVAEALTQQQYGLAVLAWGLANYRFEHYKQNNHSAAILIMDFQQQRDALAMLESITLVRNLINTPTEDMGPEHLAQACDKLAQQFTMESFQLVGDALLKENYPAIYAVGKGSYRPPRLIDLQWGNKQHPKLTLVGKGVCFDTGGLDLKSATAMRLMKKDMGGAAHVIGLANLIMQHQLPVRLRVLIPAVENAISSTAYRPGDIIASRKGLSIEIGNTDAEGRLILADALTLASEEKPDLIIDMATLTGAARVALGTEIPVVFANKTSTAEALQKCCQFTGELVWQLPLHNDYKEALDSPIADINNAPSQPYGGAIMAALFLQEFIEKDIDWLHLDLMAWNNKSKPGRPEGGEAMGLRTIFDYLKKRYAS